MCSGGARLLQIDPNELAFTFRHTSEANALGAELIVFDTAPGGAGYCDQLYDDLPAWFREAENVLRCEQNCGDSCYSCLRSYENQAIHSSLDRTFLLEGLTEFNKHNWNADTRLTAS